MVYFEPLFTCFNILVAFLSQSWEARLTIILHGIAVNFTFQRWLPLWLRLWKKASKKHPIPQLCKRTTLLYCLCISTTVHSKSQTIHKMWIYVKYTLCYSECTKVSLRLGCVNPNEPKPSFWSNMIDICHNVRSLWFQLLPQNWCIIDLMQTHHQSHLTFLAISNFDRHCNEESVYMWGFFMKPYRSFWKGSNQQINPNGDFFLKFSWLFMSWSEFAILRDGFK